MAGEERLERSMPRGAGFKDPWGCHFPTPLHRKFYLISFRFLCIDHNNGCDTLTELDDFVPQHKLE